MHSLDISRRVPEPTDQMSIPGLYHHRAEIYPGSTVVERRTEYGSWQKVSIEKLLADVQTLGCGLIARGVKPGDKVAILAATSFEWMQLDLAIMSVGAVTVPIYESDSATQIAHIITDAQVKLVFTATTQQADLVRSISTSKEVEVESFDRGALGQLQTAARHVELERFTDRLAALRIDDLATIVYTSGTTGLPRGVELTHRNFVATSNGIHRTLPMITENPKTRGFLFLPLAHVLARFVMHTISAGPATVAFAGDTSNLIDDIAAFDPTAILVVPRVLEKVYYAAQAKAAVGMKQKLFSWASRQARDVSIEKVEGGSPTAKTRGKHAVANALVLRKIRRALGPNLEYVVCGGAPLAPDLAHFFGGIGVTLLQGYGLSETTGPIAVQIPGLNPPGTVGPILMGNEVKIDPEDDEILLKGSAVFERYHNQPEQTAAAFDDGWFRTGDLGRIDGLGQLHITGRKKELLVTAGGKNVSPEILEESLSTHPLIGHTVAVGDGKPFVGALFTLDPEMLPVWLRRKGLPVVDPGQAAELPEVQESLEKAVARANSQVSRAESIRKFRIINAHFTVENEYLTPSMKLKRNRVIADFADEISRLYGDA